jgi:hypothetical protein
MNESTTTRTTQFSPCARLAALRCYLPQLQLFDPIGQQLRIMQKTLTLSPLHKLYHAFITILAGAHGLLSQHPPAQ